VAVFKFRLAPVLRWREHRMDEKRWELAALNQERRRMEAEIEALERKLADAGRALAGEEGELFSAIDLRLLGEHAQLLSARIRDQQAALEKWNEQILAKRIELVEAMRAVKSLEQLRQRQADKFDREQGLAEQKFADEVAQRKFVTGAPRKKIP
jgi:flagellar FliJ protein